LRLAVKIAAIAMVAVSVSAVAYLAATPRAAPSTSARAVDVLTKIKEGEAKIHDIQAHMVVRVPEEDWTVWDGDWGWEGGKEFRDATWTRRPGDDLPSSATFRHVEGFDGD